jgi:hypothetical protein
VSASQQRSLSRMVAARTLLRGWHDANFAGNFLAGSLCFLEFSFQEPCVVFAEMRRFPSAFSYTERDKLSLCLAGRNGKTWPCFALSTLPRARTATKRQSQNLPQIPPETVRFSQRKFFFRACSSPLRPPPVARLHPLASGFPL